MNILARIESLEFKIKEPEPHVLRRFLDTFHEIPGTDEAARELERLSEEQAVLDYHQHIGIVGSDYQERKDELDQRTSALLIGAAERHDIKGLAAWVRAGYPPTWPESS